MNKPKYISIKTRHIGGYIFDGWIEYIRNMAAREGRVISDRQAYAYLKDCIETMLVSFADSAQWPDLLGYDYVAY